MTNARVFKAGTLAVLALLMMWTSSMAQVKVGVVTAATGPGAALGIPFKNTFSILPKTLGGLEVQYIVLDDATDPTNAVKFARKLVLEDHVDILIGSSSLPAAMAMTDLSAESKTPQIALTPLGPAAAKNPWVFSVVQPPLVMIGAVVDHMRAQGVKNVAYIGFSDSWGDIVLAALKVHAEAAGIKIVTDERYARLDTNVTGQILKILSTKPDAVMIGATNTAGALPDIALSERGFKGKVYNDQGVMTEDFLRVGGKSIEGIVAPAGPVTVAEQLPDSHPIKKVAVDFTKLYETTFGPGKRTAASAFSYDAYLLADRAVATAAKAAKPGTPEFRQAVRDALEATTELVGTHAVYNMSPTDHNGGGDKRAVVLVTVESGAWKLLR
ncbi:branched-chain amino acid ABC transporter substrate-binding protein [Streptomyces sp. AcH 505]|nr:branched-chain amino acid ABC transporter substrate-binding protein [Streptomyces sp. AcH 505]